MVSINNKNKMVEQVVVVRNDKTCVHIDMNNSNGQYTGLILFNIITMMMALIRTFQTPKNKYLFKNNSRKQIY